MQATAAGLAAATAIRADESNEGMATLPRHVWIATFCQNKMSPCSPEDMISRTLNEMESIAFYKPDIICLPEVFPYGVMNGPRPPLAECAETPPGPIIKKFIHFARAHNCYIIVPIYTKSAARFYNAAVLIDRQGHVIGEYRKTYTTEGEIARGITPGPLDPPVFKTDFGIIGIQICFDINWRTGWERLRQKGADIIFWPSAFGGGHQINTLAWQNKCCIVSSTRKGITKICDIDGSEVAFTGQFDERWAIGSVNLEKAFLHTWPYVLRFPDIKKKYGRAIRIKTYHEEEWSVIESVSPDIRLADVLKEFDLKTHEEHIASGEREQLKNRP
jgi:predicted amidohydrolase